MTALILFALAANAGNPGPTRAVIAIQEGAEEEQESPMSPMCAAARIYKAALVDERVAALESLSKATESTETLSALSRISRANAELKRLYGQYWGQEAKASGQACPMI